MTLHVYVDGSGPPDSKYGYFIEETNQTLVKKESVLTNNEAEYHAIIEVLKNDAIRQDEIIIYSDSQVVVNQLNHEYGINKEGLRNLAMEVWNLAKNRKVKIEWIPREKNKAGKMLGS